MKQVWILNHYAFDATEAGGTRHLQLARRLPEFGWDASIVAASTDLYGRTRPACAGGERRSRRSGVEFVWLDVPEYHGNGIGRTINMFAYLVRSLSPTALRLLPRPDLIIGSSVHPFAGLAGAVLARRYGVPFIFEVRDLWPRRLSTWDVCGNAAPRPLPCDCSSGTSIAVPPRHCPVAVRIPVHCIHRCSRR